VDLLVHLLQESMATRFTDVISGMSVSWAPKLESSIVKLQNRQQCLRYCWYAQPKVIDAMSSPCISSHVGVQLVLKIEDSIRISFFNVIQLGFLDAFLDGNP
jgi:hypothetical protein